MYLNRGNNFKLNFLKAGNLQICRFVKTPTIFWYFRLRELMCSVTKAIETSKFCAGDLFLIMYVSLEEAFFNVSIAS